LQTKEVIIFKDYTAEEEQFKIQSLYLHYSLFNIYRILKIPKLKTFGHN